MISAAELRARQASRVDRDKEEFAARFKRATDAYYETIMSEVKTALEAVQESSYTYIILNFKPLTADFEGLKYTTMLYGYWIKEKNAFDDSIFQEQGVEKPFERAKRELAELEFKLENVSDPSVSKKLFLRLSWGEGEERPRKPIAKKPRMSHNDRRVREERRDREEPRRQDSPRREKRRQDYSRDSRDDKRRYREEDD